MNNTCKYFGFVHACQTRHGEFRKMCRESAEVLTAEAWQPGQRSSLLDVLIATNVTCSVLLETLSIVLHIGPTYINSEMTTNYNKTAITGLLQSHVREQKNE